MTIAGDLPTRAHIPDLARHGDAPAIVTAGRTLSHRDLDGLVEQRLARLGDTRRLVMVECANELEPLVTYLAALRGGHPVLLLPPQNGVAARRHAQRVMASYQPDVVFRRTGREGRGTWVLDELRDGTAHGLHPELAVLLGTSGSTGTPKLVRLSHENLRANAEAIAGYLGLDASSRAATTLPLQYCYGLSVVNSHLLAGGSIWLTDRSVSDPEFWPEFERAGATSFAGVPYTFELLARSGAEWAPSLRQVTQAGGRLAPDAVHELALLGERTGFELFVMYGQTEATARMAYLPPHLAADRPSCIGIPIEGGEFRIDDGELVYSGPNVMMGYAEHPADLALGTTLTELRTGDLAIQHDDGLYEIVGRRNRLAKLFGTRLDLDLAERMLAEEGVEARLVAGATTLRVFVDSTGDHDRARTLVCADHCLPAHAVQVQTVETFPVTPTGKPDYASLGRLPLTEIPVEVPDVATAYAGVFGRPISPGDSFVSLGGDSLSYVETFVRLERLLGVVPTDWPQRSVAELTALEARPRRRWASLETPLFLRALAIVLIVGSHVELWNLTGGAHALLAAFGFNLTRFALQRPTAKERLTAVGRIVAELMIPTFLWVAGVILIQGWYDWPTAFALNNFLGPDTFTTDWYLWFVETAVWTSLAIVLLLAVRPIAAAYRRSPFAVAVAVLLAALTLRVLLTDSSEPARIFTIEGSAWSLLLGWVAGAAATGRQRVLASALAVLGTWGYFNVHQRELIVIGCALALIWLPRVLMPRPLDRVVGVIASASLFVYVTHWQIYPHLEQDHQLLALLASLAVGIAVWFGYTQARRRLPGLVAGVAASLRQNSLTGSASRP